MNTSVFPKSQQGKERKEGRAEVTQSVPSAGSRVMTVSAMMIANLTEHPLLPGTVLGTVQLQPDAFPPCASGSQPLPATLSVTDHHLNPPWVWGTILWLDKFIFLLQNYIHWSEIKMMSTQVIFCSHTDLLSRWEMTLGFELFRIWNCEEEIGDVSFFLFHKLKNQAEETVACLWSPHGHTAVRLVAELGFRARRVWHQSHPVKHRAMPVTLRPEKMKTPTVVFRGSQIKLWLHTPLYVFKEFFP